MARLTDEERHRRRALKRAKSYDFDCAVCGVHEGNLCQNTGRSRAPGTVAKAPHKHRLGRARGYLALRGWASPGVNEGDSRLVTALAQQEWQAARAAFNALQRGA